MLAELTPKSSEADVLKFIRRHCQFLSRHRDSVYSQLDGASFLGLSCVNAHMIFPTFSDRERGLLLAQVETQLKLLQDVGGLKKRKIAPEDVKDSFCHDCITLYDNCFLENFMDLNLRKPSSTPGDGVFRCLRCRRILISKDTPPVKMMEPLPSYKTRNTTIWDDKNDNGLHYSTSYDLDFNSKTERNTCPRRDGWPNSWADQTHCGGVRNKCAYIEEQCGLRCGPMCFTQYGELCGCPCETYYVADSYARGGRHKRRQGAAGKPTVRTKDWWPCNTDADEETEQVCDESPTPHFHVKRQPAGTPTNEINKRNMYGKSARFVDDIDDNTTKKRHTSPLATPHTHPDVVHIQCPVCSSGPQSCACVPRVNQYKPDRRLRDPRENAPCSPQCHQRSHAARVSPLAPPCGPAAVCGGATAACHWSAVPTAVSAASRSCSPSPCVGAVSSSVSPCGIASPSCSPLPCVRGVSSTVAPCGAVFPSYSPASVFRDAVAPCSISNSVSPVFHVSPKVKDCCPVGTLYEHCNEPAGAAASNRMPLIYVELEDGELPLGGSWLPPVESICRPDANMSKKSMKYSFQAHIEQDAALGGALLATIRGVVSLSTHLISSNEIPTGRTSQRARRILWENSILQDYPEGKRRFRGRLLRIQLVKSDLGIYRFQQRDWKINVYLQPYRNPEHILVLSARPKAISGCLELNEAVDVLIPEPWPNETFLPTQSLLDEVRLLKRLLECGDIGDQYHLDKRIGLKQLRHFENTAQWHNLHPLTRRYDDWVFPIPYPTAYSGTTFLCTDAIRDVLILDTDYLLALQRAVHVVLLSWGLQASFHSNYGDVSVVLYPDRAGGQKFEREWSWRVRQMVLCVLLMGQPHLQNIMANACRVLREMDVLDMEENGSGEAIWTLGVDGGRQWWAAQGCMGGRLEDLVGQCRYVMQLCAQSGPPESMQVDADVLEHHAALPSPASSLSFAMRRVPPSSPISVPATTAPACQRPGHVPTLHRQRAPLAPIYPEVSGIMQSGVFAAPQFRLPDPSTPPTAHAPASSANHALALRPPARVTSSSTHTRAASPDRNIAIHLSPGQEVSHATVLSQHGPQSPKNLVGELEALTRPHVPGHVPPASVFQSPAQRDTVAPTERRPHPYPASSPTTQAIPEESLATQPSVPAKSEPPSGAPDLCVPGRGGRDTTRHVPANSVASASPHAPPNLTASMMNWQPTPSERPPRHSVQAMEDPHGVVVPTDTVLTDAVPADAIPADTVE
eukprot:GEMP01004579.1.p1 GENE.GEMP01004579.1~~GEMP01004579.1.p1  ORF type:complete len:1249 (+),score=306.76 GEMP01004579.1:227-3973(+)